MWGGRQRPPTVHARLLSLFRRRAPGFCSLKHHLQTRAAIFGSRGNFLNSRKSLRNVCFLANLFQERLQLRKNKPHLPTAVPEKFFIYGASQNKRRSHIPVTIHLSEPGIFGRSKGVENLKNIISIAWPPSCVPGTRLAHFSFTAQIVKSHHDLGVFGSGFLRHIFLLTLKEVGERKWGTGVPPVQLKLPLLQLHLPAPVQHSHSAARNRIPY